MSKASFPAWLRSKYRHDDNRFGDLARDVLYVIKINPFEEDFDSYHTLEDWLAHLDMHVAPDSVRSTMIDVWDMYTGDGISAELDFIKGEEYEDT